MIQVFQGFAPGKPRTITLPAAFITDLLPLIDDLAALKVILFTFWAVQQREGQYRYARARDYQRDAALMESMRAAAPNADPSATLANALRAAVECGALLRVTLAVGGETETLYFINAEPGRAAIAQIDAGQWQPGDEDHPVEILPERPNIFRLYEENIGALSPLIVDALKDAEKEYPQGWIEDAIHTAVQNNARSWRYIQAVLKRREQEGKPGGTVEKPTQQHDEWYLPR
ncbi:MAG: DnaD domain protein [bacterium]|nr:DnaD domain protein [bacterium]